MSAPQLKEYIYETGSKLKVLEDAGRDSRRRKLVRVFCGFCKLESVMRADKLSRNSVENDSGQAQTGTTSSSSSGRAGFVFWLELLESLGIELIESSPSVPCGVTDAASGMVKWQRKPKLT